MSQLILYLARHGESISNFKNIFIGTSENPELTEKGLHQARSLSESLKGKKIATIFSRSLIRARQTAQIVADKVGLPVTHAKDLIEVGLGRLDGHDISNPAFLSVYINMVTNWERGYPHVSVLEGELLLDIKARLEQFLNENILNRNWDGTVLLVGHAFCG